MLENKGQPRCGEAGEIRPMSQSFQQKLQSLRDYLATIPVGPLDEEHAGTALSLLTICWDGIQGSNAESTSIDKLDRAEKIEWEPPFLRFVLERHGGTVLGSVNAELHHWTVDLGAGNAMCSKGGRRRLYPADKPVNSDAVATLISDAIFNGMVCPEIEWREPGVYALLNISKIVTATNKQTLSARRKRFRKAVKEAMEQRGWIVDDKGNRMGFRLIDHNEN